MFNYPKMLYRYPGNVELQDGNYGTLTVKDEAEETQAVSDGWFETMAEAKAAGAKTAWKA